MTINSNCPKLLWSDEFKTPKLNQKNWEILLGNGCEYNICGWGNNELQSYQEENVFIENNQLVIEARHSNVGYTSGRIRSLHKFDMEYGVLEARIRIPQGQGVWPAFWMLPSKDGMQWPIDGEIDIMENVGKEQGTFHGTIHYADTNGNHLYSGTSIHPLYNDYNTFSIEKTQGKLSWMLNGLVYFERTVEDIESWPFDDKFHVIFNLAIGGFWPGNPDDGIFPQRMVVDYVRYYDMHHGKVIGPGIVCNTDTNVSYTLVLNHDSTILWKDIPPGSVASDSIYNQNILYLNFDSLSSYSGFIQVDVNNCNGLQSQSFRFGITVVKYLYSFIGIKMDNSDTAVIKESTGTFELLDNPDTNSTNTSPLCISYTRNSKSLYDTMTIQPVYIYDPNFYINGTLYFSIDILSTIHHSFDIILQLEDATVTSLPDSTFPNGVHSRFMLHVPSSSDESMWKRYYFNFFDALDTSSITSIDTITLLIEPNTYSDTNIYFGNLDTYATLYDAQDHVNFDLFLPSSDKSKISEFSDNDSYVGQEMTNLIIISSFLIALFSCLGFFHYFKFRRNADRTVPWEQFYLDPNTHEEIDDVDLDKIAGMEIVSSQGSFI